MRRFAGVVSSTRGKLTGIAGLINNVFCDGDSRDTCRTWGMHVSRLFFSEEVTVSVLPSTYQRRPRIQKTGARTSDAGSSSHWQVERAVNVYVH